MAGSEARESNPDLTLGTLHALREPNRARALSKRSKLVLSSTLAVLLGAGASLLTDVLWNGEQPVVAASLASASTPAATGTQPTHTALARTTQAAPIALKSQVKSADKNADKSADAQEAPRRGRSTRAEPVSTVEVAAPAPLARGHLTLDSVPYAIVTLDGQRLGITPVEVDLPAASHSLVLRNPELGVETTYQVTIRAGESIQRRVALE